ncbi:hypothetical protein [Marinobacterium arenosum]|uniref:hypothetical protein n=1 Tax=Marinobacterium arenosum TaxID=2862496 RepID=UPI001C93917D|nr:hypothetical protein [Marinobacterium arenosum]MBY4676942.1 hypothetical protein [Marinobacterium arenosum]
MDDACILCTDLLLQLRPHPALAPLSRIGDHQIFQCDCCQTQLHRHQDHWVIHRTCPLSTAGHSATADRRGGVEIDEEQSAFNHFNRRPQQRSLLG